MVYVSGRLDDVHEYGGKWHVAVDIVTGIKGLTAGFRQADLTFDLRSGQITWVSFVTVALFMQLEL